MRFRTFLAVLSLYTIGAVAVCAVALAVPVNTVTQPTPPDSPVKIGVGAPRSYPDTFDSGGEILTDGTSPVLVLWGQVIEVTCDALAAGERVLVCFSMHIDAVPDVTNGQLSHGAVDAEGHCMYLTSVSPTNDMRLEKTRFLQNTQTYPGSQFTGACNRPLTAYHLAPCLVADEATDCGAATTCIAGTWDTSNRRAVDVIAGAWVIADTSAATEDCVVRVDL